MNITEIKTAAANGEASAQVELAHAYRDGIEVRKNSAHYLSYLTKAAEQNNAEAIKELVEYHSNRRNKNAAFKLACYWANKGKAIGITFPEVVLLKIGDTDTCTEKIVEYLFCKNVKFEKAKELILKGNIPSDTLYSWAEKYHLEHKDDKKRIGEIVYLYLISSKGDAEKINETALTLLDKSEKDNIKIASSLFKEGYRMGDQYAAASYMHCLLVGKGVQKNVKSAAKIYYEYKDKGVILSHAFSSPTRTGKTIKTPNSMEWRIHHVKNTTKRTANNISGVVGNSLKSVFIGLFHYMSAIIRAIGVSAILLSIAVLFGIKHINWAWMQSLRNTFEGMIDCPSSIKYIIIFILLTIINSFMFKQLYKQLDKHWTKQGNRELRDTLSKFGWNLPEFTIESSRTVNEVQGCNGGDASITNEYILRFLDVNQIEHCQKKGHYDYGGGYMTAELEWIDSNRAKVTVYELAYN